MEEVGLTHSLYTFKMLIGGIYENIIDFGKTKIIKRFSFKTAQMVSR